MILDLSLNKVNNGNMISFTWSIFSSSKEYCLFQSEYKQETLKQNWIKTVSLIQLRPDESSKSLFVLWKLQFVKVNVDCFIYSPQG